MKKIWQFLQRYKQFSWTLLAGVAALGLEFGGQPVAAHAILATVAIASLIPLVTDMMRDLRVGKYGVDILAVIAIVTAVIMREFWAALVLVLMITGGKSLEDYAEHRAQQELRSLLDRAPQTATVLRGRKTLKVPVSQVAVGDKLIIKAGELVPVDALVLEGIANFDEASLTGESLPQAKAPGGQLLSGALNLDGAVTARALHAAADSQYQQIIKLVRAAANSQAPFVRLADRYAVPFTLLALTIALAAWLISGESIRFLAVLVVATPCPLILAAPIAIISGMSRATKHGIVIKTGSALERLAAARSFAFDKTGTLTEGRLHVIAVKIYRPFTAEEVLRTAAAVEQGSNHLAAQAIVEYAAVKKIKPQKKPKHPRELPGRGLQATIGGQQVLVGRLSLLQEHDVRLPQGFSQRSLRQTAVLVAVDGRLAGVIELGDRLRADSKPTLQALRQLGIRTFLMITGDNRATAKLIGRQVGIKQIHAEMLPGDKLRLLEEMPERDRPVAFVGDGVNDAPVLTAADVGIALGARGSAAASESADVVIMLDDLGRVANAVQIAKRTFFIAKQSVLVGIGLSIALMLIFATGHFPPLYGAILQEVVDVIVIFNALRAHQQVVTPVTLKL